MIPDQAIVEFFWKIGKVNTTEDEVLDIIFQSFDRWFKEGRFDLANEVLTLVSVKNSTTTLIGYLAATLPAKDKLPQRSKLYEDIRKEFLARPSTLDRVDRLTKGLE